MISKALAAECKCFVGPLLHVWLEEGGHPSKAPAVRVQLTHVYTGAKRPLAMRATIG